MQFTAEQIADLLQGEVDGDPQVLVNDLAKIEEARSGTLTFLANPKYTEFIYTTKATIAIVDRGLRTGPRPSPRPYPDPCGGCAHGLHAVAGAQPRAAVREEGRTSNPAT